MGGVVRGELLQRRGKAAARRTGRRGAALAVPTAARRARPRPPTPTATPQQACTRSFWRRGSWSSTAACPSELQSGAVWVAARVGGGAGRSCPVGSRAPACRLRAPTLSHLPTPPWGPAVGVEFCGRKLANLLHGGDLWYKGGWVDWGRGRRQRQRQVAGCHAGRGTLAVPCAGPCTARLPAHPPATAPRYPGCCRRYRV